MKKMASSILRFTVCHLDVRDLGALYHRTLRRSHLSFLGMTHETAAHSENRLNQWVSDTHTLVQVSFRHIKYGSVCVKCWYEHKIDLHLFSIVVR